MSEFVTKDEFFEHITPIRENVAYLVAREKERCENKGRWLNWVATFIIGAVLGLVTRFHGGSR